MRLLAALWLVPLIASTVSAPVMFGIPPSRQIPGWSFVDSQTALTAAGGYGVTAVALAGAALAIRMLDGPRRVGDAAVLVAVVYGVTALARGLFVRGHDGSNVEWLTDGATRAALFPSTGLLLLAGLAGVVLWAWPERGRAA